MRRRLYPQLWQGCVGAWHPGVDRSRSTILTDFSGYNNHGTLANMDPATDWIATEKGIALDFDATSQYVATNLNASVFSTAFTCSAWAKTTDSGFNIFGTRTGANGLGFRLTNPGIFVEVHDGSFKSVQPSVANANNGEWHHFSISYDGTSSIRIFYEGSDVGGMTVGSPLTAGAGNTNLGANGTGGVGTVGGKITDARAYNRTLTPSEIKLLARRPGIAYETARLAYVRGAGAAPTGFQPAWAANSNSVIIGGLTI